MIYTVRMTTAHHCHMVTANKMCLIKYHVLILCLFVAEIYALNCRTAGGPKEAELKNIYKKCLKQQENKNSSKNNYDQDWRESRGQIQRNDWDRGRTGSRENKNNRDDRNSGRDRMGSGMRDNRDDVMGRDNRNSRNDDMRGKHDDRNNNNDRMDGRNRMGGKNNRNDMMGNREDTNGRGNYFNGREDFSQSDEYGSDMGQYNNYYSSTQAPRRFKRERRTENSGQRSQYNPNSHKIAGYEDNFRSDEKNSSENTSNKENDNNKACALHCFLENLEMTGEDGMPDRYLVTHAITKDVKNEDLKDFLQESIEECFQILGNENTEDKCEFSKNLLLCLSEKGRANCDDWKDDLKI